MLGAVEPERSGSTSGSGGPRGSEDDFETLRQAHGDGAGGDGAGAAGLGPAQCGADVAGGGVKSASLRKKLENAMDQMFNCLILRNESFH